MKRFHVHVAVPDLSAGVRFYSTLFGAEPAVRKDDYAKWMLDDPRINFAISQRAAKAGVNHLGFQVDTASELESLHENLEAADRAVVAEKGVSCCYSRSDKYWITDPAGIAWESFLSLGTIPMFSDAAAEPTGETTCGDPGTATAEAPTPARSGCCSPATAAAGEASPRSACCA